MAKAGKFTSEDCKVTYKTMIEAGVTFVETSPQYGKKLRRDDLSAEHITGQAVNENWKQTPMIATSYHLNPFPLLNTPNAVVSSLEQSCERLDAGSVDLYQVEFSGGVKDIGSRTSIANGLELCVDRGLCAQVGVCNLSGSALESFYDKLDDRGVSLASNQVEFSLVNRGALYDGTLEACEEMNIRPLARNPFAGGLASGVYTASNPSGGFGATPKFDFQTLGPLKPIHDALQKVEKMAYDRLWDEFYAKKEATNRNYKVAQIEGDFETDVTTSFVSLLYVQAKGFTPIVEVDRKKDALQLLNCVNDYDWQLKLSDEEVDILDKAAARCGY